MLKRLVTIQVAILRTVDNGRSVKTEAAVVDDLVDEAWLEQYTDEHDAALPWRPFPILDDAPARPEEAPRVRLPHPAPAAGDGAPGDSARPSSRPRTDPRGMNNRLCVGYVILRDGPLTAREIGRRVERLPDWRTTQGTPEAVKGITRNQKRFRLLPGRRWDLTDEGRRWLDQSGVTAARRPWSEAPPEAPADTPEAPSEVADDDAEGETAGGEYHATAPGLWMTAAA